MYKEEEILKVLLLLFACKRKKMSGKKRKIKFWEALGLYNTVISEYYSEDYTSYMRMNAESFPNK